MRRLIFSALLVLAAVLPAAAQNRTYGSDAAGGKAAIGATGNALKTVGFCDSSVAISQASATTTELVALTAGQSIYVCGWDINVIGAAGPPTWKLVYGTGANCGTGTTDLGGLHNSTTVTTAIEHFELASESYLLKGLVSNAVCITTTTTTPQRGTLFYAKF